MIDTQAKLERLEGTSSRNSSWSSMVLADGKIYVPNQSGDVFVFGGPARLRFHGVTRMLPGTAPQELAMSGRYNLTLRQFAI